MWSHFPISSSHLREVSILLLWQTFCKRRPLLFKTPSINWKTESLFNLKKSEIFYGRQFHFAENLQVLISFVQGSLLFHEILHLREPLVGSWAFFILVLIKGGPVKTTRKSTHRCARLTCITWQYLHYRHFFQCLYYLHYLYYLYNLHYLYHLHWTHYWYYVYHSYYVYYLYHLYFLIYWIIEKNVILLTYWQLEIKIC